MIASGVGFSVMAVGIKLLGHRLENFQIGFFRVVIGFVAILPFVAGSGLTRLADPPSRRAFRARGLRPPGDVLQLLRDRAHAPRRLTPASPSRSRCPPPCSPSRDPRGDRALAALVRRRSWGSSAYFRDGAAGRRLDLSSGGAGGAHGSVLSRLPGDALVKRLPATETPLTMRCSISASSPPSSLSIGPAIYSRQWPTASSKWLLLIRGRRSSRRAVADVLGSARSARRRGLGRGAVRLISRPPIAATIGFVGFSELPTIWTFIGAAVIVASTLFTSPTA